MPPVTIASPRMKVLLQLARAAITNAPTGTTVSQVGDPDGGSLAFLAVRHGLAPLLYTLLETNHPAVRTDLRSAIRRAYVEGLPRALMLTGELRQVMARLHAGGIDALAYKGPALAGQVFGGGTPGGH